MKLISGSLFFMVFLAVLTAWMPNAYGASLESAFKSASKNDLKNIRADHWSIAGNNIIVRGNVHIPLGEFDIYADKAIINAASRDIDAVGNIQIYRNVTEEATLTPEQFARLEAMPGILTEVSGIKTDLFGNQKIKVKLSRVNGTIKAQKFSGNLNTGYFSFEDTELTMDTLVFRAKSGERKPNGVINIKDAEVSSCNYLINQNAHYSLACKEAEITPYDTTQFGMENAISTPGEYSVFATNCTAKVYGVPILWLPVFYKPKDENLGLFQSQVGRDGDWGYYLLMSKKFTPLDYPATTVRVMADLYEKRGVGYGTSIRSATENSKTTIFAYSIYDKNQYDSTEADEYNIQIPHQRYDFRISNLTHITPTLDFRGNFEIMSDEFINRDFFNDYYNINPQPVTFAALEQQFDLFTASIYVRPRVNDFFSVVEQLPTGRIDIPRQEIFDTNLYYQGETSMGYFQRKWSNYDTLNQTNDINKLNEYQTARFDTLHFFYYPIKLDILNIVPRAGFRITAYSNTSKYGVSEDDLAAMLVANDPGYESMGDFNPYDDDGGSKVRFAGEIGLELNTKIYNTWQDVRSPLLKLDGLRHVMIPYINYTYIPDPSLGRDHIYYFDDIDRIDRQNFVRLGLVNRLQTRQNDQIVNYMTMENYWDYHFQPQEGFNHIGDFCTKLSATPLKGLTLSTFFSLAVGGEDELFKDRQDVIRNGRNVGHPGLYLSWLNRWSFDIKYEPVDDFVFNFRYNYQNRYQSQSAYSMGSTLTDIESGSAFNKVYMTQIQELSFGMSFPLTPDRRTFGKYQIFYDFNAGFVKSQSFAIIRRFHCIEVAAELSLDTELDGNDKQTDPSFYVTAQLTGLMGPAQQVQNTLLASAKKQQGEGGLF